MPAPTTSISRVFVTGASGFVGSHVVYQLLEAGYLVRGAARGHKFEAVNVPDIASGDFGALLDGVDAIIHTAAPLPGRADPEAELPEQA
ncbi:hypothetical protein C8J56DRAFT_1065312 [Mycena floridula]|nr:hypothetical protein C8J56DRAFT_1065312 [Mycena floridula]